MKKLFIFCISFACILSACGKMAPVENETDGKTTLVSFNPVGEVTVEDGPLTKAAMTDDIYLVQVYKGSECFSFGYFDNLESMKMYLKQGSKYRIIVAMVKDAKNLLGSRFNLTQNSIQNSNYTDVFDFRYDYYNYSSSKGYYYPLNEYNYCFKNQYSYYSSSGSSFLSYGTISGSSSYLYLPYIERGILNKDRYPTCTDWFYGEINNYTPTGDYETLDMDFKRTGFSLKYELSGVTDGEVTVKIYNDTRTFINNTTTTTAYSGDTQFIAFYDAKSAWRYSDDYSENMTVGVVWKRGIGVTQDLGTKVIQIKRNCLNNIKIALGSDDRGAGVGISMESESSMGSSNTDIPVK